MNYMNKNETSFRKEIEAFQDISVSCKISLHEEF